MKLPCRLPIALSFASLLLPACVVIAPVSAAGPEVPRVERFTWQGAVDPGLPVHVRGINGDVRVRAGHGSSVVVRATKRGRRSDPQLVQVAVVPDPRGLTICALYPAAPGRPANECLPGGGGRNDSHDNDVSVSFELELPARSPLSLRAVNGALAAEGFAAGADARTVNGGVELQGAGEARAETVNGGVAVRVLGGGGVVAKSVNGDVKVELPRGTAAAVEGSTVNGDVESDFPLSIERRGRRISGVVGAGGPPVTLATTNGDVELRSR